MAPGGGNRCAPSPGKHQSPPENPADPLGAPVQCMGSSLAELLPGAGIWPNLMDMHSKVAGTFPTTLLGALHTAATPSIQ